LEVADLQLRQVVRENAEAIRPYVEAMPTLIDAARAANKALAPEGYEELVDALCDMAEAAHLHLESMLPPEPVRAVNDTQQTIGGPEVNVEPFTVTGLEALTAPTAPDTSVVIGGPELNTSPQEELAARQDRERQEKVEQLDAIESRYKLAHGGDPKDVRDGADQLMQQARAETLRLLDQRHQREQEAQARLLQDHTDRHL
jgi:hypothetical protein